MKKSLLLLFFVVLSVDCIAQNYQCFSPNTIRYFTNGNGYLRGMRIDSVRASGSDTIYYPYHTPRGGFGCRSWGTALDCNGGSWLGGTVIQQTNGTFLFDNIWKDTVVIKTQAILGDSWIFFDDTTQISYKATITGVDTMSFLGVFDSVKRITIEADSGGIVNYADPVNGFQIILSKHNGFVQVFDLCTFPYHGPDSIHIRNQFYDYYLDLVLGNLHGPGDVGCFASFLITPDTTNSIFRIVDFHNPTKLEMYDYNIDDMFESSDLVDGSSYGISTTEIDIVVVKAISLYSVTYSRSVEKRQTTSSWGSSSTTYSYGSSDLVADTSLMFDFRKLPEEFMSGYFFSYNPPDTMTPCPTPVYTWNRDNLSYSGCGVVFETRVDGFEFIGVENVSYALGYGQISSSYYDYTMYGSSEEEYLIYSNKGGDTCGTYTPILLLSAGAINMPLQDIHLYPNPTQNQLNISASGNIQEVVITNLLGQVVYSISQMSQKAQIDVSSLPSGMYLIKVNGTEVRKFIKE